MQHPDGPHPQLDGRPDIVLVSVADHDGVFGSRFDRSQGQLKERRIGLHQAGFERKKLRLTLGFFGELAVQESQSRKLRQTIFIGEFNLARLFQQALRQPAARDLSRFPAVVRDFSFTFPDAVHWQQIAETLASLEISEIRGTEPREIFRDEKEPSGSYALLLQVVFQAQDRTLRLEELQDWAHRIFAALMGLGGHPRFPLELLS